MSPFTVLPLEEMAVIKIATLLYPEMEALVDRLGGKEASDIPREKLKELVENNCTVLPKILQMAIVDVMKPISREVLKWRTELSLVVNPCLECNACIFWTTKGTLDQIKSAESLIRNGHLNNYESFKFACDFCLEDDIIALWSKMTEDEKSCFCELPRGERLFSRWVARLKRGRDVQYGWTPGEDDDMYFFKPYYHSIPSLQYLLRELPPKWHQRILRGAALRHVDNWDVLQFCLSSMEENHVINIFQRHGYEVLRSFLMWPVVQFFMPMARRMWNHLQEQHFSRLLRFILRFKNKQSEVNNFDFVQLLKMFWEESPERFRIYVEKEQDYKYLKDLMKRRYEYEDIIDFI